MSSPKHPDENHQPVKMGDWASQLTSYVLVLILVAFVVIIVLALLGPSVDNLDANIIKSI